ncbi:MAG: uridine kinase [Sphingobacteriaceae bacterium]|nr:uridine kinase [Sphingobacteriaceae bacterium]
MNKPFIVGIAGGSGSGKTFFLNCFLKHFDKSQISLVSQDDYYIPVGEMSAEENKQYNFDLPSTIDKALFLEHINTLIAGETVYKKEYTFNNASATPKLLELKPAPILIVEGLFILHFEEIARILDLKIFLDTEEEIALQRRLKRDLIERGYSEEDILYKWHNHVVPAYREYLLPFKNNCHNVVSNNTQIAEDIIRVSKDISEDLKQKIQFLSKSEL